MISPLHFAPKGQHQPDITYVGRRKAQEGPKSSISGPKDTRTVSDAIASEISYLKRSGAMDTIETQLLACRSLAKTFRLKFPQAARLWVSYVLHPVA